MRLAGLLWNAAAALSLLAVTAAGCSTSSVTNISASDYNQSCSKDADCMLIDEGPQCCVACGNAAINISDSSKYQAAAAQRQAACQPQPCPAIACAFAAAYCNVNKCAACNQPGGCSTSDAGTADLSGH